MNDEKTILRQAESFLAKGEARAALQYFDLVIEHNSYSVRAYAGRAEAWGLLGDLGQALLDLERVLTLGGERAFYLDQRGHLFVRLGRMPEAVEDFRRALDLEPNADRYYRYGLTLSSLGRFGEALPVLEKAVELDPGHTEAITERGMARMELGRLDLAKDDFDAAVRIDPNYHIAWSNRAAYHYRRREWSAVVANATRAIELSPASPLSYKLRALAEQELDQFEKAIADVEQFLSLDSNGPDRPYLEKLLRKLKRTRGWNRNWLSRWFGRNG